MAHLPFQMKYTISLAHHLGVTPTTEMVKCLNKVANHAAHPYLMSILGTMISVPA